MDFIEQLLSSSGYMVILVIVDRLSKQAVFIPTHNTITSAELAKLFVLHVFSKHGIPNHVTSDRGSEFILHFFRSLGKALDMRLPFTSGYYVEGDGQTKHTNQTLEQYIRMYCNYQQDNWDLLLPLAEFAYNNAPSATCFGTRKTIGVKEVHLITNDLTVRRRWQKRYQTLLQHNSINNLIFVPWLQSVEAVYVDGSQEGNAFLSSK